MCIFVVFFIIFCGYGVYLFVGFVVIGLEYSRNGVSVVDGIEVFFIGGL